jgi:hypothetical protein
MICKEVVVAGFKAHSRVSFGEVEEMCGNS